MHRPAHRAQHPADQRQVRAEAGDRAGIPLHAQRAAGGDRTTEDAGRRGVDRGDATAPASGTAAAADRPQQASEGKQTEQPRPVAVHWPSPRVMESVVPAASPSAATFVVSLATLKTSIAPGRISMELVEVTVGGLAVAS